MIEQQTPAVLMPAEQKGSKTKLIASIILIFVIITLGIYGFSWATSDIGRQKITDWRYIISTEYNPLAWYGEQLKKAGETGRVWETESNKTGEKIGIKFQDFEAVGNKIVPAGSTLAFKYKFDIGEGVSGLPLKLECTAKDKDTKKETDTLESEPRIIPSEPKIFTDNPLSYSNILCQMKTKKEISKDKIIIVEGKASFTHERQRGTLRVYFTKDVLNIGKKFFEKYGLKEKLPIRSTYNNEPVELGLGVSDENIQPIIIGENYIPSIGISLRNKWDGRVKKITGVNMYLPKEVRIDKQNSPKSTLCPFGEPTSSGANYIRYEAEEIYLEQILEFGKGIGKTIQTSQRFFCWLKIDESILGRAIYLQDQYSVDVSYDYEFQPKSETVTIKAMKGEQVAEEETTPGIEGIEQ